MGILKNTVRHFITITRHRHKVIYHCAKAGILWQGLFHDLSKYSPTEFVEGMKFYQGTRSPNEPEKYMAIQRRGCTIKAEINTILNIGQTIVMKPTS